MQQERGQLNCTKFNLFAATVPPVLSAALFTLMSWLLQLLAEQQGAKTLNALQQRGMHWHIAFLVLSQLVLLPCLSTFLTLYTRDANGGPDKQKMNVLLRIWIDVVFFCGQVPSTYLSQAKCVDFLNWQFFEATS